MKVKKQVVKILGVFMFLVFLAGVMPKEYLHGAFYDHEDVIHPIYKKGELVITKKHNHCSFLSFEFAPFLVTEPQHISFKDVVHYAGYTLPVYACRYATEGRVVSLRGPPTTVAVYSWQLAVDHVS